MGVKVRRGLNMALADKSHLSHALIDNRTCLKSAHDLQPR